MIDFNIYSTVIFDFDGVIMDSNGIKKNAITKAIDGILPVNQEREFIQYFVNLNGVPREVKIAQYVSENKYNIVLEKYETILNKELKKAALIPGVKKTIQALSKLNKTLIVLSGGTQQEVFQLLSDRDLAHYFDGVYGGPKDKQENLSELNLIKPILYFGDSEVDYLLSKSNDFDFVFVSGASSISNWKEKVKEWKGVKTIDNFIIRNNDD